MIWKTLGSAFVAGALFCAGFTPHLQAAGLTLNAAGIADGFTLTTFVGGYDFGGNYGPLAQAILPNGKVVTGSIGSGKIYVFNDIDNQTLGDAVVSSPYSCNTGNCNYAMATAGGQAYGALLGGGTYQQFANDGSSAAIPGLTLTSNLGMWGDPVNGHIISASSAGLVDIDPVAGTFRTINPNILPDGVSVSPDGQTIYVENGGTVQSYDFTTGNLIQTYNVGHSPDGTGVITGGLFDGDVIVNNNDGTLGLLNPVTSAYTIIADGGTRGDFVSPDRNNGTLFISQFEQVLRLSCGDGCTIGGPAAPEPSTWLLIASGLLLTLLGVVRRKA